MLRAAQDVLLRRGYHGTSVEEIASLADVAVGSIYTYFGSKDGLLRALVDDVLAEDEASMDRAHATGTALDRMEVLRHELLSLHRKNPIVSALALAPVCGDVPEELTNVVVSRTRAEVDRLQAAIADGVDTGLLREVDAKDAATFLWAMWSGLTTLHLRSDDLGISDEDFEKVADLGFRLLATGLLNRDTKKKRSSSSRRRTRKR